MADTEETRTEDDVSIETVLVIGGCVAAFRECHTRTSHKERDNDRDFCNRHLLVYKDGSVKLLKK